MCGMWRFVLLLGSVLTVGVKTADAEPQDYGSLSGVISSKYDQQTVFGIWGQGCCAGTRSTRFEESTDKQILDYLVDKTRYDHRMRPSELTIVNVTVLILSLSSPDESSLKYEVEFLMHQQWIDPRLKYQDGGRHRYLNGMEHINVIWLPDTYFIKHGEFKHPLIPMDIGLKIYPDGRVQYSMRRSMILNCQGNLHIFPFDNLKCPFAIESVSHEQTEMELKWPDVEKPVDKASSLRHHNAYLAKSSNGICDEKHTWRGNFSCLRVLLVFTRDKSFYVSTVFVPGMVLVTSSFISFWLDINAVPARVMIGVTTMLNFCTTTNSFRSTLPVVSNLTAMNLWDGVCMFFIYASMLEFIIVNYLYRKLPHITRPSPSSAVAESHRPQSALSQGNGRKSATTDAASHDASTLNQEFPGFDNHLNHRLQTDKARAAASVFAWLRRPQFFAPQETPTRPKIAKTIDNVSKMVFPVLFGIFTFSFFLTFAFIKPNQEDNWKLSDFVTGSA